MKNKVVDPKLIQARRLLDEDDYSLSALGSVVGLSPAYLQRCFRTSFGLSPAEYRAQVKLIDLKHQLRTQSDVTRAVVYAGYSSPSRVYQDGAARLGMLPGTYQRGGEGIQIHWALIDSTLGRALIATTDRGICAVALGEDDRALEAGLRKEFPKAQLTRVQEGSDDFLAPRVRAVAETLRGLPVQVPLEFIGTAFQQRVWHALMTIPRGQTMSYAELAQQLGQPRATRAVARACAQNRLAVVVPCHRVIRGDGSLGGYRWGLARKRELLDQECHARSLLPA